MTKCFGSKLLPNQKTKKENYTTGRDGKAENEKPRKQFMHQMVKEVGDGSYQELI